MSDIEPMDIKARASDVCVLPLVRRVAAMLDQDPARWDEGMALPHGWELILFTPLTRQSDLRADGHHLPEPSLGAGVATKVMLGGRRFRYLESIPIGARVTRTGVVASVTTKEGRAGSLTIVTRRYRTVVDGGEAVAIEEEEDMVYRPVEAGTGRRENLAVPAFREAAFAERVYCPDEIMLFRYSVLSNNAHRIHYDHPFATGTEGYPGLVVNGGLTALMLVEMFRDHVGRQPRTTFTKMMRPLFCGSRNLVRIAERGDAFRIWVENEQGQVAAEAIIQ